MWIGAFSDDKIYMRAELIHRFVSYPIMLEYEKEIWKKIKIGFSTGLVIANRRLLTDTKFSGLTKQTGVYAAEVTDEKPYARFDPYQKLVPQGRGLMYIPLYSRNSTNYSIVIGVAAKYMLTNYLSLNFKTNYQLGVSTLKSWREFDYIRHEVYSGLIELSYSLSHLTGRKE
jgi:hypothetical protein